VEDDSMVALRNGPQAPGDRIAARNSDAQVHLALRWIGATDFERSEGQRFLFEQRHVVIVQLTKVAGSPFALELPGRAQVDDRTDAKALKHSKIRRGQPQRARAEDATPSDRSPISRQVTTEITEVEARFKRDMPVHHHCDATRQGSSDATLGTSFLGFHANRHDLRRYEYGQHVHRG
jgi:hypothetical protein